MRRGTTTRGWVADNTTDNLLQIGSGLNTGLEFVTTTGASRHSVLGVDGSALNIVKKVTYGEDGCATSNSTRVGVELEFTNSYFDGVAKDTHSSITYKGTDNLGGSKLDFSIEGTILTSFDESETVGNTRFLIYDVDNGTLERVTVGVADSGGAGFKVLRIAN